jgi:hypothetical protein
LCGRGSIVQALPQSGFPAPDTGDKKFNSRLVAPTVFQKKPFGESVEGLSYLNSLPFSHMAPSSIRYDLERGIFARST